MMFSPGCCICGTKPTPPGGVGLPGCFCLVPPSLSMTSGDPSCNYGMFQSCSITYGPPNGSMRMLGFQSNVFTSEAMFYDRISQSSFFYYFSCQYNEFFLTRIYPTSPFGSPYRDGILYHWILGGYANTCVPFSLLAGQAYPGSDASCSVQITG